MRVLPFALGGLLLTAALPTFAQTTPTTPAAPRYYVGVAAYSSYFQEFGKQPYANAGFRAPVQLTAGFQVRPRIALQLGVAYSGATYSYDFTGYSYSDPSVRPVYFHNQGRQTVRTTSVSLLSRYTLTRNPAHRLQFDALAGISLEHGSGYHRGSQTDSLGGTLNTNNFSSRGSQNLLVLNFGLGTRYRLTPRFELNFDLMANSVLPGSSYRIQGLTSTAALGLRYRFGKR
jgi:hypothetical protein